MTLRSLREEEEFTDRATLIEETRHVDEALEALTWALTNNAEQYPIIPGTGFIALRLARTKRYRRGSFVVPALKVWFSILDDDTVLLRMITIDEAE